MFRVLRFVLRIGKLEIPTYIIHAEHVDVFPQRTGVNLINSAFLPMVVFSPAQGPIFRVIPFGESGDVGAFDCRVPVQMRLDAFHEEMRLRVGEKGFGVGGYEGCCVAVFGPRGGVVAAVEVWREELGMESIFVHCLGRCRGDTEGGLLGSGAKLRDS